jgi:methionyl aminopeptidase
MSKVIIKNNIQLENLRDSGKYLTELLDLLYDFIRPGIRLIDIEKKAQEYLDFHNLKGAFKGYH